MWLRCLSILFTFFKDKSSISLSILGYFSLLFVPFFNICFGLCTSSSTCFSPPVLKAVGLSLISYFCLFLIPVFSGIRASSRHWLQLCHTEFDMSCFVSSFNSNYFLISCSFFLIHGLFRSMFLYFQIFGKFSGYLSGLNF